MRDLLAIVQALDIPYQLLDGEQLRARTGARGYRLGLFTEVGHLVQPAALIRGLADALPDRARLFEQSPVMTLRREAEWRIETPDAHVTADTVIIAANSAIKGFGYLRDRLVTIYTYAAITKPLSAGEQGQLGSMASWGVLPAHRLGTTLRRVGDDRLLVRSLYAYERGIAPELARSELLKRLHRRWPELAHIDFEHAWGGTTALTLNGAPCWGQVDVGLYTSAGCNGSGIVKGTVLGRKLAEHITGREVSRDLLAAYGTANWIAPEPLRAIGFNVVSAVERRRAGNES